MAFNLAGLRRGAISPKRQSHMSEATSRIDRDYRSASVFRRFDIVALAASAGGLTALTCVLEALPSECPAPVVIVQHLAPRHSSHMADILAQRTALKVSEAKEGDLLGIGMVLLAPPDSHLLVMPDRTVSLSKLPLVNFVRPCADVLFESVAAHYHERAIAVVLTGTGRDGANGLQAIRKSGGVIIVQDMATSEFGGMPDAAIHAGPVDFILPLKHIGPALVRLMARGTL